MDAKKIDKAVALFKEILGTVTSDDIMLYNRYEDLRTGCILGSERRGSKGWQSVFIHVKDITPDQLKIWMDRKLTVSKNTMKVNCSGNITCLMFG